MTHRTRLSTLAAVLAPAALAVLLVPPAAAPAAQARPARFAADTVAITVQDVSPTILPTSATPAPLTVTLTVTNRSESNLTGLTIEGERGEPLTGQAQLDDAIKHVSPPSGHIVPIRPTHPVRLDLAAGATADVVFRSTTSTSTDAGLCNCASADRPWIYPLYFTGHVKGTGGVDQVLGLANTFVSAFSRAPAPVHVGWVWPLLDQPHLLDDTPVGTGGPVFSDDFLTASVATGGRLDRSLAVLERVAHDTPDVPLTVVLDPELLNELELMATGPYQVRSGRTRLVAGTGKAQATAWLDRLRALLDSAPQLRLQLTPYADPDVQSLHEAGLTWSTTLPAAIRQRVATALGGHSAGDSLAWPAGGTVSRGTLGVLAAHGVGTLLIDSRRIAPRPGADAVRPGLARLSSGGRDVGVGLLDPTVQRYVQQAVTATGGPGLTVLPQLMSELSVRAVQEPTTEHVAVLAPSRWVDPEVDAAALTIERTSRSLVTRPISLGDAVGGELIPNGRSRLTAAPASAATLPEVSVAAASKLAGELPTLRELLTPARPATLDPEAAGLLAVLPLEGQRVGSSAWGRAGNEASAARFARGLTARLDSLTHGVAIVTPSGSYTLASDNSPLPITVENNLPYPVTVSVEVTPLNGLPGFKAKPSTKVVGAHQKATLRLATSVDRTGRIRVVAALYTADGQHRVGDAVEMTVRSTALGVIGVIITVAAGAVLVLALVIRFGRRLQKRRRRIKQGRPRRPHLDPDAPAPTPVGGEAP